MWEILSWLFFIIFIAGLLVVGGLLLRGYMTAGGQTGGIGGAFFTPKPEKRLDVVEQTTIDGRRRLVLIRRDNVEHLIMTGGPVDVVIETEIDTKAKVQTQAKEPSGPSLVRPARKLGQVSGGDG